MRPERIEELVVAACSDSRGWKAPIREAIERALAEEASAISDIHARGNLARRIQEIRSAVAPLLRDAPGLSGYIATIDGICHDVQEVERERDEMLSDLQNVSRDCNDQLAQRDRRIAERGAAGDVGPAEGAATC